MSSAKADLLRFIARHEPLEKSLEQFPSIGRKEIQSLLEAVAEAIEPEASVPAKSKTTARKASGPSPKHVRVYSDGAARGNPGPSGAGAVVTDAEGNILERLGRFLGKQTNNHAEYMGLVIGLEAAQELGAQVVDIFADSQLMIRQLQGKYQVKSESLRPLFEQAQRLIQAFDQVTLNHIPREENSAADEMSNRAIDERL